MRTPELRVNSGVWWGFVMRIRINLSSLPLTPTVLFSGVISTLVTHLFLLPSCHHSPFLFTSLYHLLISSFPACTTAPNGEHVLIIFPGDINWTGCSNLLSCIWTPEYVGSFFFFLLLFLFLSLSVSWMKILLWSQVSEQVHFILSSACKTLRIASCPRKSLIRCFWWSGHGGSLN